VIAHIVLCQDGEVIPLVITARSSIKPRSRRGVGLDTDDRLHTCPMCSLHKVDDSVEDAVVRYGHCGLPISGNRLDEILHARSTVEHRELGVDMKMGEAICHGDLTL
jgi:hypothetical protein